MTKVTDGHRTVMRNMRGEGRTIAEIAVRTGLSQTTVWRQITTMRDEGATFPKREKTFASTLVEMCHSGMRLGRLGKPLSRRTNAEIDRLLDDVARSGKPSVAEFLLDAYYAKTIG